MSVFTSSGLFSCGRTLVPPTDIFAVSLLIKSMRSLLSLSISKISQTESIYLLRISQNQRSRVALISYLLACSGVIPFCQRRSLGLIFVKSTLLLYAAIRLTALVWFRLKTRFITEYSSIGCTREAVAVTLTPSRPLLKMSTQYHKNLSQFLLEVSVQTLLQKLDKGTRYWFVEKWRRPRWKRMLKSVNMVWLT